MSSTSGLKPCPFCGSKRLKMATTLQTAEVVCLDCHGCSGIKETKMDASRAWNRRAGGSRNIR